MTARSALASIVLLALVSTNAMAEKRGDKSAGEEDLIRRRVEWFYGNRGLLPGGSDAAVGRAARARAAAETRQRVAAGARDALASSWTMVGPAPMTMVGWAMGNVAGRVTTIAVDPTNASILYVGGAAGGFWKSTNGGQSWTSLFDQVGTQTIGSAAIAPYDHDEVWVGTGDFIENCEGYFGLGVFRSTDGGTTWLARNGSGGSAMNLSHVASVVLHPTNPSIVIVAGTGECSGNQTLAGAIYRTTDAGLSWTKVYAGTTNEVVRDAGNANVLYAAVPSAGVKKSTDGGATWANANSGLSVSSGRVEIAISPSNPQVIYCLSDSRALYRTTDGGASWTQRNSNACDGQCWYNMTMKVGLTDPDTLYRGTVLPYKSTNGGTSSSALTSGWGGSQTVHQDIQHIERHPTDANTIFIGSDGGLWKTTNGGSTFSNLNGNLNMTQFYDVAVHPTLDTVLLGGAQDNSSEAYSGSVLWDVVEVTGDGFVNGINSLNPNYCYIASYPSGGPSVARSTTGPNGNYGYITGSIGDSANWVTPYVLDPVNPDKMYLGTYRVWRSTNRGTNWTAISTNVAGGGTLLSLAVAPSDTNTIYTSSDSGPVYRTTDGGGSWTNVTGNLPAGRAVNRVAVDPADAQHVFAAVSVFTAPQVWYSTTGGTTWTAATNGIPAVPANCVLVLQNPYRVFVGNDVGIFVATADAGPYVPDMAGFPQGVPVTDLEYNAVTGTITAGTYGRGAWQSPTTGLPPVADFSATPTNGPAPLNVNFTDLSTNTPSAWAWTFGDGGTSSAQNPSHTYVGAGTYTVSLTATNSFGSDIETKTGYITVTSGGSAPVADFSATPTIGTAPLGVTFTDLSTNTPSGWAWTFGDGASAATQSPSHAYAAAGLYTVSLTATNAFGSDTETKVDYISVTGGATPTDEIITGAGPAAANGPVVKTWDHATPPAQVSTFSAYGAPQWGTNVAAADMVGGGSTELATGPGPGAIYGPQIRGFGTTGSPIAKVNFYAYGTLRYGAHPGGGDVDGDGHDELLTTPGPGAVFGPHVRAFNYDGVVLSPVAKVSFFAYGTLRYGARSAGGDVDGERTYTEILTGAGAGAVFGPHVRAFQYDAASVAAYRSLFAFATGQYGAAVASGDVEGDGTQEAVVAHGPDPASASDVKGFHLDGGVTTAFTLTPFGAQPGGAEPAAGDLDADATSEVVVATGWGTASASRVTAFEIVAGGGVAIAGLDFDPYGQSYGAKVAMGDLGI